MDERGRDMDRDDAEERICGEEYVTDPEAHVMRRDA